MAHAERRRGVRVKYPTREVYQRYIFIVKKRIAWLRKQRIYVARKVAELSWRLDLEESAGNWGMKGAIYSEPG